MKIVNSVFLILLLMSCESINVGQSATNIKGVWSHTYLQRTKSGNSWGNWEQINTFAALPNLEFRANGDFLMGDKPGGAECCQPGNTYKIEDTKIIFNDQKNCPNVSCLTMCNWDINAIKGDTLILQQCNSMSKYVRVKK